jgi:hypothetical protein
MLCSIVIIGVLTLIIWTFVVVFVDTGSVHGAIDYIANIIFSTH